MFNLRFYFKPEKPVPYSSFSIRVDTEEFSLSVPDADKKRIRDSWHQLLVEKPRSFSVLRELGNLHSAINKSLVFHFSDFMTYAAVARSYSQSLLSEGLYDSTRVGAVGCALITGDNKVVVQQRRKDASHVKGVWDCSAAGLVHVKNGCLDFEEAIYNKLFEELNITREKINNHGVITVHTSFDPDFSGMLAFLLSTPVSSREIEANYNMERVASLQFLDMDQISDFVVQHYMIDMNGDGCAVLSACLENDVFLNTVKRLREKGFMIQFGSLRNGIFYEEQK